MNKRMLKKVILALSAFMILFSSACEKTVEPEMEIIVVDEKPSAGGTMIMGSVEPKSLNPLTTDSRSFEDVSKLLFESLVAYDASLKLQPVLAESWEFAPGTAECTIKLKSGIQWSDGTPVTAQDVVYSLDTIKAAPVSLYKDNIQHIYSYAPVGDSSIKVVFDQAYGSAVDALAFPIIPKHSFEQDANQLPATTGSFKIAAYHKLESLELEQNDKWIGLIAGAGQEAKPYIEKIKVNFISEVDAFSTAFQARQLDVLNTLSYDWEKYSELKDVSAHKYTSMYFDFIGLNFNKAIFQDKEVRQAILRAINRADIVDKYLLGNADIADMPINPNSWLYDNTLSKATYNTTTAENLLKEAGFEDTNGDKVLEKTVDGVAHELRFTLLTNAENEFRQKAAQDIKRYLESVGFAVDISYAAFEEMQLAIQSKQFDAVLTGYNLSPTQDLSFAFHSSQIEAGKNYYSYSNPAMDELLLQAYTAMDEAAKKEAYQKLQKAFAEELPCIGLFFRQGAIVTRNKIKGEINPDAVNQYRNINQWFVSKQNE